MNGSDESAMLLFIKFRSKVEFDRVAIFKKKFNHTTPVKHAFNINVGKEKNVGKHSLKDMNIPRPFCST